jgi:phosphatidylglycerophosphate synthase
MVTLFGLAMHVPTAYFIATGHFLWAAAFLVVFGLFDTLDGGLARAQGKASPAGMLLDASTDRFKEVMLYTGAAYWFVFHHEATMAAWAVLACGASLSVSYVKAKGEAAIASGDKVIPHATLNRMFSDGLLTFELRMALIVAGLLVDQLAGAVVAIAILASFTAVQRLVKISKQL